MASSKEKYGISYRPWGTRNCRIGPLSGARRDIEKQFQQETLMAINALVEHVVSFRSTRRMTHIFHNCHVTETLTRQQRHESYFCFCNCP
jgi:hypothetical protein